MLPDEVLPTLLATLVRDISSYYYLPADTLMKCKKQHVHSEKQHLIYSRFELLKARQQFCGDISTLFQRHCLAINGVRFFLY